MVLHISAVLSKSLLAGSVMFFSAAGRANVHNPGRMSCHVEQLPSWSHSTSATWSHRYPDTAVVRGILQSLAVGPDRVRFSPWLALIGFMYIHTYTVDQSPITC